MRELRRLIHRRAQPLPTRVERGLLVITAAFVVVLTIIAWRSMMFNEYAR